MFTFKHYAFFLILTFCEKWHVNVVIYSYLELNTCNEQRKDDTISYINGNQYKEIAGLKMN